MKNRGSVIQLRMTTVITVYQVLLEIYGAAAHFVASYLSVSGGLSRLFAGFAAVGRVAGLRFRAASSRNDMLFGRLYYRRKCLKMVPVCWMEN